MFKNVRLTESESLQLRLEAFNVTNTATATPHMTFGATNLDVIDNYADGCVRANCTVAVKF